MLTTGIPNFDECQMHTAKAKKNTAALRKHDYPACLPAMFILLCSFPRALTRQLQKTLPSAEHSNSANK